MMQQPVLLSPEYRAIDVFTINTKVTAVYGTDCLFCLDEYIMKIPLMSKTMMSMLWTFPFRHP
jgi:hypothetical protein